MRLAVATLVVAAVSCGPVPAWEPALDDKGAPIIRLSASEAAMCASSNGCRVVTTQALMGLAQDAYRMGVAAGTKAAEEEARKERSTMCRKGDA